jgi:nitrogen fixation/metabolism regulation signal transduction histidine kinase
MATERRLFLFALSGAIPATALVWISIAGAPLNTAKIVAAVVFVAWLLVVAGVMRGEFLRHTRTISNLVESARIQDYSMKATGAREPGELGELYQQINRLTDSLKAARQGEHEVLSILEKIVSQINVAIIVFDARDRIRLVNRLACALLNAPADKLIGTDRAETALARLPAAAQPKVVDFRFPGADGRWQVLQHRYRHQGETSHIMFISDLKQVLLDEEIAAWQRLIRIVSHEVNNSLTPIASLCQTLTVMLAKIDTENGADLREGLSVIAERAKGLQDFISVYTRAARLPEPYKIPFSAPDLATKLKRIFAERPLEIVPFPPVTIFGDPVHIEQALINLIKNGLEANPIGAPHVEVSCQLRNGHCEFHVADHGAGVGNPDNLFVPFYTTKAEGTGIGLALCRQIAAKHHGQVSLENREDGPGAVAKLVLPLPPEQAAVHT